MNYRIERWTKSNAPNPASLRGILISENYRVFQWQDAPGAVYSLHEHERDQSHWIISGALELTIENVGSFFLKAGDRDFMPAGTRHSARVVGEDAVVYLVGEKVK